MDPDFAERLRKQVTPKKATVCNFIELYILYYSKKICIQTVLKYN